jgi:hypothetical protein
MNEDSRWRIHGYSARLRTPILDARVDLLHPEEGLLEVRVSHVMLSHCRLLQFLPAGFTAGIPAEALAEAYVRGDDLIATYLENQAAHVRPQVYWRHLPGGAALAGVELILSAQTSQLHSLPRLWCQAQWNRCEAWQLIDPRRELYERLDAGETPTSIEAGQGTSLVLLRPQQHPLSVATAVHPADFHQAELSPLQRAAGCQLRYWLFPENLEKGVIRRARIRTWFVPRDGDAAAACGLYSSFLSDPLPLSV